MKLPPFSEDELNHYAGLLYRRERTAHSAHHKVNEELHAFIRLHGPEKMKYMWEELVRRDSVS